ncbi:MAG: hypothetical protein WCQ53_02795 [bacterium]
MGLNVVVLLSFLFSPFLNAAEQNIFKLIDINDLTGIQSLVKTNDKIVSIRNAFDLTPFEYALSKDSKSEIMEYLSTKDADYSSILDNVTKNGKGKTIDYSKIWPKDSQVLFIGEKHSDFETVNNEIINMLPKFKEQGLTHFATEFQLSGMQSLIDQYQLGLISLDALLESATKKQKGQNAIGDKDLSIIKESTRLGIKVLALDISTGGGASNQSKKVGDVSETSAEGMRQRNDNWTKLLEGTINASPKARILVYCGMGHSNYRTFNSTSAERVFSVTERLQKDKYTSYNIRISRSDMDDLFQYAAIKANFKDNKFMIYPKNDHERQYVFRSEAVLYLPASKTATERTDVGSIVGGKDCSSLPYSSDFADVSKKCELGSSSDCYKKAELARMYKCGDMAEAVYGSICDDKDSPQQKAACYCLASLELDRGKYDAVKKLCKIEKQGQEEMFKASGIQKDIKMCSCSEKDQTSCSEAGKKCNLLSH